MELGPIQRTFDGLFKSISLYFQSAQVEPDGPITETDLSSYFQDQLRSALDTALKRHGFVDLPYSIRITVEANSKISGIHRSDEITAYDEVMKNGSHRTFNFYSKKGPENMRASYYWLNTQKNGEQTHGILTMEERWYLRTSLSQNLVYYQRIERANTHL